MLTLSSSLARNSTNAAWTSSSGGAGRLGVDVLGLFGFGVGRDPGCDAVPEDDPGPPVGGAPGVDNGLRLFMFGSGVCMGVACGLTPLGIMGPFGVGSAPPGPGPAPVAAAAGPLGVGGYPFAAAMPFAVAGAGCDCG